MMTRTSLSEKYHPQRFGDLWQGLTDPAVRVVSSELTQSRISSPTLFTGPYGGGKTSISHIVGLRWACEQPGESPFEPCLVCGACRSILRNVGLLPWVFDHHGYVELDCARMLPEKILELITEEVQRPNLFCPGTGFYRAKTIIMDEFGRLTDTYQRKFLKLLETRNAIFLLCCADEDKLDPAIRQRCSIRPMRLPSLDLCSQRIVDIATKENATASPDAARLLAQRCGNNPRDILKVLNDALVLGDGRLSIAAVEDALGLRSSR